MILQIDDWIFDIDIDRTMEYSSAESAEHCDCAYCRNFYAAMDSYLPSLRPFLAQFGVDAEAPDTLYPYDVHQDLMWYEGDYVVFGTVIQTGKRPLNDNGVDCFLIVPLLEDEYELLRPHFVLSLDRAQLPWILDEPMEDVISPANDPSFLQEMWDRLLEKAENTEIS